MAGGFLGGSVEVLLHQHSHKLAAGQPSQPLQPVADPEVPAGGWVTASEFNAEHSQDEPFERASVLADRLQVCLPAVPELRLQPVQPEDLVPACEVLGKHLSASLHLSHSKPALREESAGLKLMLHEAAAEQHPSTPRSKTPAAGSGLAPLSSPLSSGRKAAPAAIRPSSAPPPLPAECTQAEQGGGTAAWGPVEPGVTRKPALKRAAAPMLEGKLKAKVAKLPAKAAGTGWVAGTGDAAGAGSRAGASKAAGTRKHAPHVPASTDGRSAPQLATAISGEHTAAAPAANAAINGSAKKSLPAPAKPRAKAAEIDLAQTELKLKEKQATGKLGELSIPQLKVLLKARRLPLGGKKADLVTRLQGHLAGSQA